MIGHVAKGFQRREGKLGEATGFLAGFLQAKDGGVGGLVDCFVFAGRLLEYVRTQDLTAYVRKASKPGGTVPSWAGSKMPLSSELADAVQDLFDRLADACEATPPAPLPPALDGPELQAALPMLHTQARLSRPTT